MGDPERQQAAQVKTATTKLSPKGMQGNDEARAFDLDLQHLSTLAVVATNMSDALRPDAVKAVIAAGNRMLNPITLGIAMSPMLKLSIEGAHAKVHNLGNKLQGADGNAEIWAITSSMNARYNFLPQYPTVNQEKAADKAGAANLDDKEQIELGLLKLRAVRTTISSSYREILIDGGALRSIAADMIEASELLIDKKVRPLLAVGQQMAVLTLAEYEVTEKVVNALLDDLKQRNKRDLTHKLKQPARAFDAIGNAAGRTDLTTFAKTQW